MCNFLPSKKTSHISILLEPAFSLAHMLFSVFHLPAWIIPNLLTLSFVSVMVTFWKLGYENVKDEKLTGELILDQQHKAEPPTRENEGGLEKLMTEISVIIILLVYFTQVHRLGDMDLRRALCKTCV